jgi:hypothetical protein
MLGLRASSWRCCDVRPASDEQQHGASRGNRPAVRRFVRRGRKIQRNRTVPMTATAERMVAMRCFIVRARTATRAACARSTGAADSGGSTRPTVTEERASIADQREGSAEPLGGDATTVRARAASSSMACRTRPTTPPGDCRCGRRRRASRSDAPRARSRGTAHRSERILTAPAG